MCHVVRATLRLPCTPRHLLSIASSSAMSAFTLEAAASASAILGGPLEKSELHLRSLAGPGSFADARLVNVDTRTIVMMLSRAKAPRVVLAGQPLEIDFDVEGTSLDVFQCAHIGGSVARSVSAHTLLQLYIEADEHSATDLSVLVVVRHFCNGWNVRALLHPTSWKDAASVTVLSISFAGRTLPCTFLPATLRVGFNHAPAPEGAIFRASTNGNVQALRAALDAGGSTEEADGVRGRLGCASGMSLHVLAPPPRLTLMLLRPTFSLCCRLRCARRLSRVARLFCCCICPSFTVPCSTTAPPFFGPRTTATLKQSACFLRQAPTPHGLTWCERGDEYSGGKPARDVVRGGHIRPRSDLPSM